MSRILNSIGHCLDTALSRLFFVKESLPVKKEFVSKTSDPSSEDVDALRGDWQAITEDMRRAVYRVLR